MAELKDFTGVEEVSLDAFIPEQPPVKINNIPSSRNMAATSALMSEEPLATFDRVMAELDLAGSSQIMQEQISGAKMSQEEASKTFLLQNLQDPEKTFEEKQSAFQLYQANRTTPVRMRDELGRAAAIENVLGETVSAEESRASAGEIISQVNDTRNLIQSLLNEQLASKDQGLLGITVDIAESILPFGWNRQLAGTQMDLDEGLVEAGSSFVVSGEERAELARMLQEAPEDQKLFIAQRLVDAINNNPNIVLPDENKLEQAHLLMTALDRGYYTEGDRWVDNAISLMESTGVLIPLAKVIGVGRTIKSSISAYSSIARRRSVAGAPQPAAAANSLKETNPEKYRAAINSAESDESGQVAEAMFGADKTDVVGNAVSPEPTLPDDVVINKPTIPVVAGRPQSPNPRIVDVASQDGAIYYKAAELAGARAKIVDDFRNATGLIPRTAMTRQGEIVDGVTGEVDGINASIRAVYGTTDGGFDDVADAIDRTKRGLAHYGVTDDEISILLKDGEFYRPVPVQEALQASPQDFLVQVNTNYRVVPEDVPLGPLNVKWNVFDRAGFILGGKHGSFQRMILDPASMLDPTLTLGANARVDKGSLLMSEMLNLGKNYTDVIKTLPKNQLASLEEEILRANFEGRAVNKARILDEGFSETVVKALNHWKEYWDTAYHLENRDLVKTLRSRGYQAIENSDGTTKLFGRPVARRNVGETARVYDVESDSILTLNKEELDYLYETGGTLSQLRSVMKVGDEAVGGSDGLAVLVRNQPGSTTTRALKDSDEVLNYREGYYSVRYKSPYFIVKNEGSYERAVGVAGSYKEAKQFMANLAKEGGEYRVRGDVKGEDLDELNWQISQSTGRSAQRVRGERLQDATDVTNVGIDNQYVVGPVDSLIANAKSISHRLAMRDYLEAGKARFLKQFSHLLPTDKFGRPMWPSNVKQIGRQGELWTKELADARTTFEYLHYLENGYINAIDEGWRGMMRFFGYLAGQRGWSKAERAAYVAGSSAGPVGFAKNAAFQLYLALNPLRQIVVQSHQAIQLTALHPKYVGTRLVPDSTLMIYARIAGGAKGLDKNVLKAFGRSREEVEAMYKAYMDSGLAAAIDQQNFVRGSLADFADDLNYKAGVQGGVIKKGVRGLGQVMHLSRRIGFDTGEEVNMITAWLTMYDRAGGYGKVKTQRQLEEVAARARDYTYNMNMAGDMPYNQNWLAAAFQFMQVPHKALLQFTFNRNMTAQEKARIAMFNTVMYGVPSGSIMYSFMEKQLPEEGPIREIAIQGLESYTLNTTLSMMTDEDVRLNWTGLAAGDMAGLYEFVTNMATTNPMDIMANSPSGQLIFGNNPRLTRFAQTVLKLTNFMPEDGPYPTTGLQTIEEGLSLASGLSNAFKARAALAYQKKFASTGKTTDSSVSWPEAVAAAFGFETQDEMLARYVSTEAYEETQAFYDDLDIQYAAIKRQLAKAGLDGTDAYVALDVINWMNLAFEGSDRAKEYLLSKMRKDAEAGDYTLWENLLKSAAGGVMDMDKIRQMARSMPESEYKATYMQLLKDMDKLAEEHE